MDNNEYSLLGYNTVLAIIFLFPVVGLTGELKIVLQVCLLNLFLSNADLCMQSPYLYNSQLWAGILATGLAGFLINIAVFLQIKHTSSLTNNISGTAKAAVQTIAAVLLLGDVMTATKWLGNFLVIIGSALYSYVRLVEMRSSQDQQKRI